VVSSTPQPNFTPGKDLVPIVQEAGCALGLVWTGVENRASTGIRSLDCPECSQLVYQLSYLAHFIEMYFGKTSPCRCVLRSSGFMIPYSLVEKYHCSRDVYYLHLHCRCEHLRNCICHILEVHSYAICHCENLKFCVCKYVDGVQSSCLHHASYNINTSVAN
jgi:hypothetical protein